MLIHNTCPEFSMQADIRTASATCRNTCTEGSLSWLARRMHQTSHGTVNRSDGNPMHQGQRDTPPQSALPHFNPPHLTSPRLISPHLTLPHLTTLRLTSPNFASPHLASLCLSSPPSPLLTLPHLIPCPTLTPLTSPYLAFPRLAPSHLSSPFLTSPCLSSPLLTSPHFIPPSLTSLHLWSHRSCEQSVGASRTSLCVCE